ncbi:MAG: SdpI family protein, partial [Candidatus Aenigmatarchaeota archaeon]
AGEVDGYMTKFWGVFLMPLVLAAVLVMFWIIPKIDPLKRNIAKFRKYYDELILLLAGFLFYIHSLTIVWNLGYRFNMSLMIIPAMGFLFYYLGILTENAKRNWFVGIRTPWTMSSERVWDKTHRLGGKMFKASALIAFSGLLVPEYAIWLAMVPVLFSSAYLVIYSYLEYRKTPKDGL